VVIVTDEEGHYDALRAATEAGREHPSRTLVVVSRRGREARLDAEIRTAGERTPGESVVMRLHGELAQHAESVVLPLLLPDAPVVTWWPGKAPDVPANDPLGQARPATGDRRGGVGGTRWRRSRSAPRATRPVTPTWRGPG
jgi:glucose-6-phosphate dehydrogenase assembly protein OpcA